jgi:photosystem II PsbM protein
MVFLRQIGFRYAFERGEAEVMQTSDLGFVATLMFILVPTVFLLILYIQTASREGKGE